MNTFKLPLFAFTGLMVLVCFLGTAQPSDGTSLDAFDLTIAPDLSVVLE